MSEAVVFVGILTELIDKLLVINNSSGKKVNEMQSMQVRVKNTSSETCKMVSLLLQAKCCCRNT